MTNWNGTNSAQKLNALKILSNDHQSRQSPCPVLLFILYYWISPFSSYSRILFREREREQQLTACNGDTGTKLSSNRTLACTGDLTATYYNAKLPNKQINQLSVCQAPSCTLHAWERLDKKCTQMVVCCLAVFVMIDIEKKEEGGAIGLRAPCFDWCADEIGYITWHTKIDFIVLHKD